MGLFNIFKTEKKETNSLWKVIENEEDWQEAVRNSFQSKVLVFKHSTRCMISRMVLNNFEKDLSKSPKDGYLFYYLDLLKHREISNAIAEQMEVTHQSPQILVLEKGKSIYNASHNNIQLKFLPYGENIQK